MKTRTKVIGTIWAGSSLIMTSAVVIERLKRSSPDSGLTNKEAAFCIATAPFLFIGGFIVGFMEAMDN